MAACALARDASAPVRLGLVIANASPNKIAIAYNELLNTTAPATSAYTITASGGAATVSSVAIVGAVVEITLNRNAAAGETLTLTYTVPGSNPVRDRGGNGAPAFASQAVTNNVSSSSVLATDSFTGTDGTTLTAHTADTGQSWSVFGAAFTINSNALTGSAGQGAAQLNLTPESANYRAKVRTVGMGPHGLIVRRPAGSSGFEGVQINFGYADAISFLENGSVVGTQITYTTTVRDILLAGAIWTIDVADANVTMYVQRADNLEYLTPAQAWTSTPTAAITSTTSILTAGRVALLAFNTSVTFDDLEVSTAGGGGGPSTNAAMFISGHSLTEENIPSYASVIQAWLGVTQTNSQQNAGGTDLNSRGWNGGSNTGYLTGGIDAITTLRGATFDYGVFAEFHDLFECMFNRELIKALWQYCRLLWEQSPSARACLYTTWQYHNTGGSSASDPSLWIAYENAVAPAWEAVVARVNESLAAQGYTQRVTTLPMALAVAHLVSQAIASGPGVAGITQPGGNVDTMGVLFVDGVHLTNVGKYYAACVLVACLTRQSVIGAPTVAGVTSEQATSLQTLASNFASSYYASNTLGPQPNWTARQSIVDSSVPVAWTYLSKSGASAAATQLKTNDYTVSPLASASSEPGFWPAPP